MTGARSDGPAVTAVIPAYNMEAFLARALESAVDQTYPDLEVIVVDDGSTDRTRAIAERFADRDSRVRVVSVANGGVAAARNLGTRMASTPYVAYLDADDLWHCEKIARQVAAMAVHGHEGEWVGCYTLSRYIDAADRVLANGASADARGDFFDRHLYRNHLGNGSCLLVRRDAALAVGGFDPDHARRGLGGLEDYELQLKLLRRHKLEVVREFLVGYRVYHGQMSDDPVRMARARVMTIESVLRDHDLEPHKRVRVLSHGRIMAAYREMRAGAWGAAAAELAGSFMRAPGTTMGLIAELTALRLSKLRKGYSAAARMRAEPPAVDFRELAPTDGVAASDDINDRPRARLAALRVRSASQAPAGEAQADRTGSGRPAHSAR